MMRAQAMRTLQGTVGNARLARMLASPSTVGTGAALQRKCACGGNAGPDGECAACMANRQAMQRKVSVSSPGDPAEREADTVADKVMRMAESGAIGAAPVHIQRQCAACGDEKIVQKKQAPSSDAGSSLDTDAAVRVTKQGGAPLSREVRSHFEPRFGRDLSSVRVHTGSEAAGGAQAVQAKAYTVGNNIVFGSGQFAPGTHEGQRLLAHELTHVAQQTGASIETKPNRSQSSDAQELEINRVAEPTENIDAVKGIQREPVIQRKIKLRGPNTWLVIPTWKELGLKERQDFLKRRFGSVGSSLEHTIVEDMADSADDFFFEDEDELFSEIFKRAKTSRLMRESQKGTSALGESFGYPSRKPGGCGPRVNIAAKNYWGPVQSDSDFNYYFELSEKGRNNAYEAIKSLFTPQKDKCNRTLIHCDYLASVVHMRVFAEKIGTKEFDSRVKGGTIPLTLKWNGFEDIEQGTFRSSKRESLQEVRPKSEGDLVVGDHVIFWNHRAYDLINEVPREAWRLENAILVDKVKGMDKFLGHGSGEQTNDGMRKKLMQKYNEVAKMALNLITKTSSGDKKIAANATAKLRNDFPNVKEVGGEWRIQGSHFRKFDEKLRLITDTDPELIGLRDPGDPTRMNLVKRPVESE
jgi:hypothetical protein